LVFKNLIFSEKEIPLSKFMLHEPFCLKYIIKCEKCFGPISIDDLEEHNNDFHELLDCQDCGKKFEKKLLSSHNKKCVNKLTTCSYCSLEVSKKDLREHEYMCGSKTENCVLCGEFIPIMGKNTF